LVRKVASFLFSSFERAGELLTEFDGRGRYQYTQEDSEGDDATRREAGFSEHQ
jgi:hypothetical protein